MLFAACNRSTSQTGLEPVAERFTLRVLPESFIDDAKCAGFTLRENESEGQITVFVDADRAQGLKALYLELDYDASRYSPVSAASSEEFAALGQVLSLSVPQQPGRSGTFAHGSVLANWPDQAGYSGSGNVATFVFAKQSADPATQVRSSSAPPMSDHGKPDVSYDPITHTISWLYTNPGDYDQNSEVGITDLTPLGANFGAIGPFDPASALWQIDGDGNGVLTIADITPIGVNFRQRVEGYQLARSDTPSDYPASNASVNGPGASVVAGIQFEGASGLPGERKSYQLSGAPLHPLKFYWVRPFDGLDSGTPSNFFSGAANGEPVLFMVATPTSGPDPLFVSFDGTGTFDPDGDSLTFSWDFEDDGTIDGFGSSSPTASFTYTAPGTYIARMHVTDYVYFVSKTVEIVVGGVANIPPVAQLSATPNSGSIPLGVTLDASASFDTDGSIPANGYDWDFDGDGVFEVIAGTAIQNPIYSVVGVYLATVIVYDNLGAQDTIAKEITVTP
jgi:PKD repeat protein